jgi:anti-sigma factor RsiW
MMNEPHVDALIPDYALGLLSESQREQVAQHVARCERCRAALQLERALMQHIQRSLHVAAQPPAWITEQAYRQQAVRQARIRPIRRFRQRTLALALLLCIFVGGLFTVPLPSQSLLLVAPAQAATVDYAAATLAAATPQQIVAAPSRSVKHVPPATAPQPKSLSTPVPLTLPTN